MYFMTRMGEVPIGHETVEKYGMMYIHEYTYILHLSPGGKKEYLVRYRAVIVAHPNLVRD